MTNLQFIIVNKFFYTRNLYNKYKHVKLNIYYKSQTKYFTHKIILSIYIYI